MSEICLKAGQELEPICAKCWHWQSTVPGITLHKQENYSWKITWSEFLLFWNLLKCTALRREARVLTCATIVGNVVGISETTCCPFQ